MGGRMVPRTAASIPAKPPIRQPTRMAALTAMAPGEDWARAMRSSISSSASQWSSSTKRRRMKVTMTKPPPKVQALMESMLAKRVQRVRPFRSVSMWHPFLLWRSRQNLSIFCTSITMAVTPPTSWAVATGGTMAAVETMPCSE